MRSTDYIARKLKAFMCQAYPLDDDVIRMVARHAVCDSISKSQTLCRENEPFDKVVFVSEGIFRLSRVMNGEDHTIAFGVEGDPYISLATYLYNKPSLFSYNPVTDGETISVPQEDFKRLVAETELVMWFNKVLQRQIHALENRWVWLGQQDTCTRYLKLMKLRPQLMTHVPLKYIASYLGVTPSSLSRIRAQVAGKKHSTVI